MIYQFEWTQVDDVFSKELGCTELNNGFIGRLLPNRVVKIINTHEEVDKSESEDELYYNEENTVVQQIMENKVIAVCDAMVDDNSMARY